MVYPHSLVACTQGRGNLGLGRGGVVDGEGGREGGREETRSGIPPGDGRKARWGLGRVEEGEGGERGERGCGIDSKRERGGWRIEKKNFLGTTRKT
jgi:hypothetical protein